ncbi:MAG: hypothetical protein C0594_03990, partial [Marinilabiliales bacterium]
AAGKDNTSQMKQINQILNNIKELGGEFKETSNMLWSELESYRKLKMQYDEALQEVEKEITYAQIISSPFPADKKSYPVRWVIVLLSAIATLFFTIVVVGFIESKKK